MNRVIRYQGAILLGDHILLLKVHDRPSDRTFWVLPGGGLIEPESDEECVQREMREETHLVVKVGSLLLDEPAPANDSYERLRTYQCTISAGEASPGLEPETDDEEHRSIRSLGWFDLRDPSHWDPLMVTDPITYPQLERLRAVLGYSQTFDR